LSEEGGAGMRKEKQGRARNGTDEQGEVGSSRGWQGLGGKGPATAAKRMNIQPAFAKTTAGRTFNQLALAVKALKFCSHPDLIGATFN